MLKVGQFVLVQCPYGNGPMVGLIVRIGPSYFTFPSSPKVEVYFTEYEQSYLYQQQNVKLLPQMLQILFE